ncbi:MAG: type IV toxin-antitoxin system AbiEi family antitoxin domain-containing protein [Myxococcales bacterium]|nr:type IV toxin-antitoxin system AbiEi family antitoxin domain-containing protein [Myxococcales bacterium]
MLLILVTSHDDTRFRNMAPTQSHQVLELARAKGAVRARDLVPLDIPRTVLSRLVAQGALIRTSRGVYVRADANITEHHSLVEVAVRVPGAAINLLSALAFHGLTDELPVAVWIAVKRGNQAPRLDSPRIEVTWTAERFLRLGVTRHMIEGVDVAITNPARTVADCFKYRSRVGVDVAVAALRDYLKRHRTGRPELWNMAGACRVQRVIRPYLEALS